MWNCTPASHLASDCENPSTGVYITGNTTVTAWGGNKGRTLSVNWTPSFGTVAIPPGGQGGNGSLTAPVNYGDTITLTASPNPGYFTVWHGQWYNGDWSGERYGNDVTIKVTGNHKLVAWFRPLAEYPSNMKSLSVVATGGSADVYSAAAPTASFNSGPYQSGSATGPQRFSFSISPLPGIAYNYLTWLVDNQRWYSTNGAFSYEYEGSYTAYLSNKIKLDIETEGQGVVTSNQFRWGWNPKPYQHVDYGTSLTPLPNANEVNMTATPCLGWVFDHWEYKNDQGQTEQFHYPSLPPLYMNWWTGAGIRVPNGQNTFKVKAVFLLPGAKSLPVSDSKQLQQDYCNPGVQILDADITKDNIRVMLTPIGGPQFGSLTLELFGPGDAYFLIRTVGRITGIYDETFNIPNMPLEEYDVVVATWTVGQDSYWDVFSEHFRNLGMYLHSQYNTPHETDPTCQGGTLLLNYCLGDRASATGIGSPPPPCPGICCDSMWSDFSEWADRNGNGVSICAGELMFSTSCDNWSVDCPDECPDENPNSLEAVSAIETACLNTDLGDDTVAVKPNHLQLNCEDRVYIHGLNSSALHTGTIKRVTDRGGGLVENQCDNYNPSDHRCSDEIVNLGNFITIKLFEN